MSIPADKCLVFSNLERPNAAGTPELLVPQRCASRLMRAKRKRLKDARRYAICNLGRGPDAVRRLLLASHAGRNCGPAGFRARPARRWLSKWATHRRRFPGTRGHPRTYARATSWRQWLEPGSRLLPAGGCRRLAGRQQYARGRRLDPARTRRLRALRGRADRPPPTGQSRVGRIAALLLRPSIFAPLNCHSSYRAFPETQSQKP